MMVWAEFVSETVRQSDFLGLSHTLALVPDPDDPQSTPLFCPFSHTPNSCPTHHPLPLTCLGNVVDPSALRKTYPAKPPDPCSVPPILPMDRNDLPTELL